METRREDIHALLPWFVSATLDPEEAAAFERHLPDCNPCRRELEFLNSLRENIDRYGEEFFSPHPAPEMLVKDVFEGLPEPQAAELRRHIALCATCAKEARILRQGEDRAEGPARPPTVLPGVTWKPILPWAAAAAVVLALGLPIWWFSHQGVSRTGLVPPYYLELPQRDLAATLVQLSGDAETFQLVVPVDLPRPTYPLAVEIRDAAGRLILSRTDLDQDYHYRDRFLFVVCDRRDFPDGDYRIRIRPSSTPQESPDRFPLEFTFRVASP